MPRVRPRRATVAFLLVLALMPGAAVSSRVLRAQAAPVLGDRLILEPAQGTVFRVETAYPNEGVTCEAKRRKNVIARYRGRLEILRLDDTTLAVINHVTFDEYLRGISEVPRSWPFETLKAQVVAARSYGLYHLQHPQSRNRSLGFDICATDQCQVYRGVNVEQGAFGDAWIRAVAETRGQVLRHDGEVIQAFYHSTSPGRTKTAFPGGRPLPYLRSVAGQDEASPVSRWSVTIPFTDLGPILAADGEWPGGGVGGVSMSGDTVRVSGSGRSVSIAKSAFRGALNSEAACVFPAKYPTLSASGKSKLPQTVPSIDFSLSVSGASVVLTGRGWGHGVGMTQYGAKALAEQGRSYADIVAYFYNGIRPEQIQEPGLIRVLAIEDASLVRIGVEGSATVTTTSGSTLAPGDRFEVRSGRILDVRRGVGPSLVPVLKVEVATPGPIEVTEGDALTLAYTLSGAARVTLILNRDGAEVIRTSEVSQTSGANAIALSLSATSTPSPSPTPVTTVGTATPTPVVVPTTASPGSYEVVLEAFDGLDRVRTAPIAMTIAQRPSPKALPKESSSSPWRLIFIVAGALLLSAGAFFVTRRVRKRPAA